MVMKIAPYPDAPASDLYDRVEIGGKIQGKPLLNPPKLSWGQIWQKMNYI